MSISRRRRRLALLACALGAGCSPTLEEPRELTIVVTATPALGDDAIQRIRALQLEVGGAESATLQFSVEAAAWRSRRLVYRPGIARGELSLRVVGRDGAHVPIGEGTALVSLDGRRQVEVTLMLSASPPLEDAGVDLAEADLAAADLGAPPDMAARDLTMPPDLTAVDLTPPPDMTLVDMAVADMTTLDLAVVDMTTLDLAVVDMTTVDLSSNADLAGEDLSGPDLAADVPPLVVSPTALTLFTGGTRALAASEPVTWSVVGGNTNGTITADGVYTPPIIPGSYTVEATTQIGPIRTASVAVTVISGGMELVAGTLGGIGNIDGTGIAARFGTSIRGVASDGQGNLYLSDSASHTIRKVALSGPFAGLVTTLAGQSGVAQYLDAVGTAAAFNAPNGLAVDGNYLYVADVNNHKLRRIVLSGPDLGTVTTVAGNNTVAVVDGIGTAASCWGLNHLTSDGQGNLYFVDLATVRKYVIATGEVITIAGSAAGIRATTNGTGLSARFFGPYGIAWQPAGFFDGGVDLAGGPGNLYISDSGHHVLRKIDLNTMAVTTLAGQVATPAATDSPIRFNQPEGLAIDGDTLYVADRGNCLVRAVDLNAVTATTLAGAALQCSGTLDGVGAAARFQNPHAPVLAAGALWVAQDFVLRKLELPSTVTTFAGAPPAPPGIADGIRSAARFASPQGVARDGQGNLYVCDTNVIRKVVLATGEVTTPFGTFGIYDSIDATGTAARFETPYGCVIDGNTLYISDPGANVIRAANLTTLEVTTLAGSYNWSLAVDGVGSAARFNTPKGLALDGAGNLYVADSGAIRKIVLATAAVTTVAGRLEGTSFRDGVGPNAFFNQPDGIAFSQGLLYVGDFGNQAVRCMDPSTGMVVTVAGPGLGVVDGIGFSTRVEGPGGVWADPTGLVYVTEKSPGVVRVFDPAAQGIGIFAGTPGKKGLRLGPLPSTFSQPVAGVALGPNDFIVVDFAERSIVRVH